MIKDPPRRINTTGMTALNRDYFVLTFLYGFFTFVMIVFLWVLTIPYYLHYKVSSNLFRDGRLY